MPEVSDLMPLHALVVDDEPTIREVVMAGLREEGYVVRSARHGAEALAVLREQCPRVVVLDLMMPVVDGWSFLEQRQQERLCVDNTVVVLSAYRHLDAEMPRLKELGASEYLSKPFDLDKLLDLVGRLVAADAGSPRTEGEGSAP